MNFTFYIYTIEEDEWIGWVWEREDSRFHIKIIYGFIIL